MSKQTMAKTPLNPADMKPLIAQQIAINELDRKIRCAQTMKTFNKDFSKNYKPIGKDSGFAYMISEYEE